MGWIGWTEAETLDATMSGILLAYDGRQDLLKSIFGGGETSSETAPPKTKATPDKVRGALRLLAGGKPSGSKRHNAKGKAT